MQRQASPNDLVGLLSLSAMKLSFSVSSKSSSKPPKPPSSGFVTEKSNKSSKHEFVKEFDSSKTLANDTDNKLIIPPLPNEWRPLKKMKNLDLPGRPNGQDLQFEVEAPSSAEIVDTAGMSFGLNLRRKTLPKRDGDDNGDDVVDENNDPSPRPFVSVENALLKKLKDDLERLPEHRGMEEFDDCPVEGFGAAILAGYGWVEGRGIGKNAKEDVKSAQYERKAGKEGLGFDPDAPKRNDGKKAKERNRSKEGIHKVGKEVRVVRGRDIGCRGRIVEVLDSHSVILKLSKSGEEVQVMVTELADLGSEEEDKCLRKLKDLKMQESNSKHENRSRNEKSEVRMKESKRSREEEGRGNSSRRELEKVSRISWLTSHIRVRIISKELKGGRLYLKKGEVVDVVGPNECDISMDGSKELIQGVNQDLLETVLPRRGEPVLVLYGKHKGLFGHLVEKDAGRETGVIRDADTHELLNVKFEQIAEFIGDPSLIGY